MKKPKVLLYDIETTPNLGYTWGKYQQDVIKFKDQRRLLCVSWKWLGNNNIGWFNVMDEQSEKAVLKAFSHRLNAADIVIAHNGDEFDRKIIKSRMLYHGLNPIKVNCSIDTKKVAKKYFSFNSNSMADLCDLLKIGEKVKTPGINLWVGCMGNDSKAWKLMKKYNIRDVKLLEKLYKRLLPWLEDHPNIHKILHPEARYQDGCNKCGSKKVEKRGKRFTTRGVQQQYQCQSCSGWFLGAR